MRLLKKLLIKLVMMVVTVALFGAVMRLAKPYIMKSAGVPETAAAEAVSAAHFSSEESDLMGTIFKSALRFFTGKAKRDELAGELSDKLYGGRPGEASMAELGIELEKPGAKSSTVPGVQPNSSVQPAAVATTNGAVVMAAAPAHLTAKQATPSPNATASGAATSARDAVIGRLWQKAQANPELSFVPVVLVGMCAVHVLRRRRSPEDDFVLPDMSAVLAAESSAYEMQHSMHALDSEDFELLVAMVFQTQGYRVTMPAGLSGGRGGDFVLQRKSERLLVQCRRSSNSDIPVDRVRELHEAAVAAGVTRAMYVAGCNFSWDARNFAKTKGVTLINARTLDTLITEALSRWNEELLPVSRWVPKLMSKVKVVPPLCPSCEATMDEVKTSGGSSWLCSQRPECRGRRSARKSHTASTAVAAKLPTRDQSKLPAAKTPQQAATVNSRQEEQPAMTANEKRARTIQPAIAPNVRRFQSARVA